MIKIEKNIYVPECSCEKQYDRCTRRIKVTNRGGLKVISGMIMCGQIRSLLNSLKDLKL